MNADYGAKPITCPKPVLESAYGPPMLWNPVVKFDFQWAWRHPAHQRHHTSSVLRHSSQCLYLTRPDLFPDPRNDTPWQALYHSQNDHAFITTMGFNVGRKVAGWSAYIRQSSRHFSIKIQKCRAMKM